MAQFEAFKVYEDDEKYARIEEILKAKAKCNVYSGTAEDRYLTKTEVAEMRLKGLLPLPKPAPCPMSVEKHVDETEECKLDPESKEQDELFTLTEYSMDIYKYLREHELRNRAKAGYMKKQPDVDASMRTTLVAWLVEVAEEYKLQSETLYLAVNYIDRFLSYMSVVRAKLQLVGVSAIFLASKYEEIYPPDVGEFVYITDDTYTKRQVIRMEHLIVKVLGFDLSAPTPLAFLTTFCSICPVDEKIKFLAMVSILSFPTNVILKSVWFQYLCELTLLDGEPYLEFLPSQLAASSIMLAQLTLNQPIWPADFVSKTGYNIADLSDCMKFVYRMFIEVVFTTPIDCFFFTRYFVLYRHQILPTNLFQISTKRKSICTLHKLPHHLLTA